MTVNQRTLIAAVVVALIFALVWFYPEPARPELLPGGTTPPVVVEFTSDGTRVSP